jgi:hypothetical protein
MNECVHCILWSKRIWAASPEPLIYESQSRLLAIRACCIIILHSLTSRRWAAKGANPISRHHTALLTVVGRRGNKYEIRRRAFHYESHANWQAERRWRRWTYATPLSHRHWLMRFCGCAVNAAIFAPGRKSVVNAQKNTDSARVGRVHIVVKPQRTTQRGLRWGWVGGMLDAVKHRWRTASCTIFTVVPF